MPFVAFVKADTEEAGMLCGKCKCRKRGGKMSKVPSTASAVNAAQQTQLPKISDLVVELSPNAIDRGVKLKGEGGWTVE